MYKEGSDHDRFVARENSIMGEAAWSAPWSFGRGLWPRLRGPDPAPWENTAHGSVPTLRFSKARPSVLRFGPRTGIIQVREPAIVPIDPTQGGIQLPVDGPVAPGPLPAAGDHAPLLLPPAVGVPALGQALGHPLRILDPAGRLSPATGYLRERHCKASPSRSRHRS